MLIGLVTNGILIVEFANQLREQVKLEAILGFRARLRPI
jgi:multidrug efflux pump subunit AcrB